MTTRQLLIDMPLCMDIPVRPKDLLFTWRYLFDILRQLSAPLWHLASGFKVFGGKADRIGRFSFLRNKFIGLKALFTFLSYRTDISERVPDGLILHTHTQHLHSFLESSPSELRKHHLVARLR